MITRRRLLLTLALLLLAARPARAEDGFSESWERYKASLDREWSLILKLNERVKLHNATVYDARVREIAEDVLKEKAIQEQCLKALSRG
jgi:hypothetical protein